jgi:flagellar basal-body rod protein FlgB
MLNPIVDRLDRFLSLVSARQQVTASNIANADTPGYKTRDLDFKAEMLRASGSPGTVEVSGLAVRNDGNNVSLDRESRNLAENALKFNIAAQMLQAQVRLVRAAIQEGRQG